MKRFLKGNFRIAVSFACVLVALLATVVIGGQVYAAEDCAHSYDSYYEAPTCDKNGYTEYTCVYCGDSYREVAYSVGHNIVFIPAVEPTCDSAGHTVEIACDRCGYVMMAGTVKPALGHRYQTKAVSPTCTEKGYTLYTCSTCGHSYRQDESAPFGHEFHQSTSDTDPDTVIYSCLMCGYTYTEKIEPEPPHEHSYRTEVTEPTCTQSGFTLYICDDCGYNYIDGRTPAHGHKFSGIENCVYCGADFVLSTVAEGYCGGEGDGTNLKWKLTNDGVITISGKGAMKSFRANAPWKSYRALIKTVVIENGVTTVGYDAFDSCTELRSAVIGNTVTLIEDFAFGRCEKLTSVTVGYNVESISGLAFCYCPAIMEIVNYSILDLRVGDSTYGELCANALEVHSAKSKLASKGEFWFYTYSGVTYLIGYDGVDEDITLPADFNCKVYEIYANAFSQNNVIKSVDIGDGVTKIGRGAFANCGKLAAVTIGRNVTEIGEGAFAGCDALTSAVFSVSDGWSYFSVNGSAMIDYSRIANATEAAKCLTDEYCSVKWVRGHSHSFVKGAVVAPTCTRNGYTSYFCDDCGYSYVADTVAALGHIDGDTVIENRVDAGCVTAGSYESVAYCTVCGEESSRDTVTVPAIGHIGGDITVENRVEAGCDTDGYFENVIYCTVCGGQVVRESVTVQAKGHTAGETVIEKAVEADCVTDGSYDSVVYCTVCRFEISRETVVVSAIGHMYDDDRDDTCNNCGEKREIESAEIIIAEGRCGASVNWKLLDGGVLVIYGNGAMEDLFDVSAQPWKAYKTAITKVVVEEGVIFIGRNAFYGHTAITEVVLPESLMAIEEYAFFGCSGITEFTVPGKVFYIGKYSLRKTNINTLTFANAEGWAFQDGATVDMSDMNALITALRKTEATYSKTFMKAVEGDGTAIVSGTFGKNDAFNWTLSDTGVLTVNGKGNMPKFNVNTTPWYGYRGAIRTVVIGDGITSIGRCSFHTCRAIISVSLPDTVETIAQYAFYNLPYITEIEIPGAVTRIEEFVLRKCISLERVEMDIYYGWFIDGNKLAAVELYNTTVDAFLKTYYNDVWVRDVNAPFEDVNDPYFVAAGACNSYTSWKLVYIDEAKTQMKLTISGNGKMPLFGTAATPWYGYAAQIVEVEVEAGVTNIGRCAFYNLNKVTKVTLPEGLTSIDAYAFSGCKALKEIDIPDSVTYIDPSAFTKTGLGLIPTV